MKINKNETIRCLIASIVVIITISMPHTTHAQKAITETINGDNYAVIIMADKNGKMLRGAADRTIDYAENDVRRFFYYAPVYYVASDGSADISKKYGSGNYKKMLRHTNDVFITTGDYPKGYKGTVWSEYKEARPEKFVSAKFAVAHAEIGVNGTISKSTMNLAEGLGYAKSATSSSYQLEINAVATGCFMFQGRYGNKPDEIGKWRMPTMKELQLIYVMEKALKKTAPTTGFENLIRNTIGTKSYYWSGTSVRHSDKYVIGRGAWMFMTTGTEGFTFRDFGAWANEATYIRCVRDLPFP